MRKFYACAVVALSTAGLSAWAGGDLPFPFQDDKSAPDLVETWESGAKPVKVEIYEMPTGERYIILRDTETQEFEILVKTK